MKREVHDLKKIESNESSGVRPATFLWRPRRRRDAFARRLSTGKRSDKERTETHFARVLWQGLISRP